MPYVPVSNSETYKYKVRFASVNDVAPGIWLFEPDFTNSGLTQTQRDEAIQKFIDLIETSPDFVFSEAFRTTSTQDEITLTP